MELFERNLWIVTGLLTIAHVMGERNIILNPSDATVSMGETVIFRCTVTAATDEADTSDVVWVQEGTPISNNYEISWKVDSSRYSVASGRVNEEFNLQITNVNTLDAGSYACVVRSAGVDVASSTTAYLRYKTAPQEEYPRCSEPNKVYREGEEVSFTCRSGPAVPRVNLTWVDEDLVEVYTEQRSDGTFEVAELATTLTRADNGKRFQCNLTHVLVEDQRTCGVGPLVVQYPPSDIKIEATSEEIVDDGGPLSLTCKAEANPSVTPSDIEWMVPSDIPEDSIQRNGGLLTILEVDSRFNGMGVECVARNEIGEAKTSFVISVRVPSTTTVAKETTKTETTSVAPTPTTATPTPTYPKRQLPEKGPKTPPPQQDSLFGLEKNFMIALIVGVAFLVLCFVMLLFLVFGKKRGKTIVVVNSEDNLRKLSASAMSTNGTKLLLGTPVMDRRIRTPSDNPSDDQSIDSAIHLISPIGGDHPDYRGQVNRSKSNVSAASSQSSGPSYIRVPSTELLIDPASQQRGGGQPRYVVLDMVGQNGQPFPSADPVPVTYATTGRQATRQPSPGAESGQLHAAYATTGRQAVRQPAESRGFETIPLRSVSRDQHEGLYVRQGGQYIPVQHISGPNTPEGGHSPVIITVGEDSDSSQEEISAPERMPFLDPRYRPV